MLDGKYLYRRYYTTSGTDTDSSSATAIKNYHVSLPSNVDKKTIQVSPKSQYLRGNSSSFGQFVLSVPLIGITAETDVVIWFKQEITSGALYWKINAWIEYCKTS